MYFIAHWHSFTDSLICPALVWTLTGGAAWPLSLCIWGPAKCNIEMKIKQRYQTCTSIESMVSKIVSISLKIKEGQGYKWVHTRNRIHCSTAFIIKTFWVVFTKIVGIWGLEMGAKEEVKIEYHIHSPGGDLQENLTSDRILILLSSGTEVWAAAWRRKEEVWGVFVAIYWSSVCAARDSNARGTLRWLPVRGSGALVNQI